MSEILIISRYYPPEVAASGICVSQTARELVALGHQVTVLTTVPNYPTGVVPEAYRGKFRQSEWIDGVRVVRIWSYVAPNRGFLKRILAQLSFGCLIPLSGWSVCAHPDIILVSSPPLFTVIGGRLLSWLKGCPLIVRIADLWPESAIQLGVLHQPLLIKLAEWLEWSTYQQAKLVWVVTSGIQHRLLERGLTPEKILLLTNGVDTTIFHPASQLDARAELGWDQRFTVLYAGTHGLSHGLLSVLQAAELLQAHSDIHIILAGDGAEKAHLLAESQKRGLQNVTFLAAQPHQRIPLLLAATDVSLVHVRKLPLFQGMLPIKMYEAMACRQPVLLAVDGEAHRLAEEAGGAAYCIEPENPEALARAILYLQSHPEEARIYAHCGRALVEKRFSTTNLTAELDKQISELLAKQQVRSPLSHKINKVNTIDNTVQKKEAKHLSTTPS